MTDAFDITKLLGAQVSKLDTAPAEGREQIEYIDIDRIDDDPNNFYALSEIDELASNIELFGLQQPLRVRPNPDDPDRVILVSGHRRRAAIRQLVDGGRTDLRKIACIRERAEGSAALQELRLIYANSDTRRLTSAEISKQAERVETLLYQLKEEGYEFPGRMRDQVAAACQVSAPKLARLKVIRESLIPAYMELFNKDKLPEQTAYALARLPGEFQERLNRVLAEPPSGAKAEKLLARYNNGWRWEPELTCPDGKACKRGDTFLRRDCESSVWSEMCGGNTCCLNCDMAKHAYSPCERMCSKARAVRKEKSDQKKAAEHERMVKAGRKYQKETERNARRLLRAIDAAGLSDTDQIPWEYYTKHSVAVIRKWAAGEFDDPAGWSYAKLLPGKCHDLMDAAKLLGCSTDFLLGLTEDIAPAVTAQQKAADAAEMQREELPAPTKPPENLCEQCKAAHPWCDKCCDICDNRCNGRQSCRREDHSRPSVKADAETAWHWWPETPTKSGLCWCITAPLRRGGGLYWWNDQKAQWEDPTATVPLTVSVSLWMRCPELPTSMRWERQVIEDE